MASTNRAAETAQIIAGAVYRREDESRGGFVEAVMSGVWERPDGARQGYLSVPGYTDELVVEGTESFKGWELVARPTRVKSKA